MFSSKGLFKHIICPMGAACRMPNCIFGHEFLGTDSAEHSHPAQHVPTPNQMSSQHAHEQKRRKLDSGAKARTRPLDEPEKKAFVGSLVADQTATPRGGTVKRPPGSNIVSPSARLQTAQRVVSPPSKAQLQKSKPTSLMNKSASPAAKPKDVKKETLNPRPVPQSPEQWGIRTALLEKLHEVMVPLNKKAVESSDPDLKAVHLDDNSLIKAALDEEEKLARTQGKVYKNVIKLRIMAYKKMKIEEWKQHRLAEMKAAEPKGATNSRPIETDLTPEQETMFLARLVTNQDGLEKHGYVTAVPSEAEIQQAKAGVEAGAGWEVCDRCKTRFQVFPDRRVEDGALTSGGRCTYHWGKPIRPTYKRTDTITGRTDPRYTCCNEPVGTAGCSTQEIHVFKISEAKRLAAVMPFVSTPPNSNALQGKAVCFDCEMGYTVHGLELIRLTATTWPDGEPLIDVLVRPIGTVLDLNTRFSGVTPEQFFNASAYDPGDPASANPGKTANEGKQPPLRIVSCPAEARSLLLSYIAPETPLVGHALENDLNSVRLVHPTIVDTVALYPHPKGLPLRLALKGLAKGILGKEIQTAGADGHDSLEDARATGELVRAKVAKEWRKLKAAGWTVRAEGFFPPLPKGASSAEAGLGTAAMSLSESENKRKRGASDTNGADGETAAGEV